MTLHSEEELPQAGRAWQETAGFRKDMMLQQVVEHRLARPVQLGARKARYFGRQKTKWQLLLAAAVANLVLVAAWERTAGSSAGVGGAFSSLLLQLLFFPFLVPQQPGGLRQRPSFGFTA